MISRISRSFTFATVFAVAVFSEFVKAAETAEKRTEGANENRTEGANFISGPLSIIENAILIQAARLLVKPISAFTQQSMAKISELLFPAQDKTNSDVQELPSCPVRPKHYSLRMDVFQKECPTFKLVNGNLSTAKIIFFGEDHSRYIRGKIIECVDALAANNPHDVYLEGAWLGETLESCLSFTDKPGRICRGWDDKKGHGGLYSITGAPYGSPESREAENIIHHIRNQSLIKTVLACDKNWLNFFVVGRAHLVPKHEGHLEDIADAKYVQDELKRNLDQDDYAVVIMRSL